VDYQIVKLRDGRDLEFAMNGVDSTSAVIFHQSTLCDLSSWASWLSEFETLGIRAVAFNRSGYGQSSGKEGRRTIDVAHDVSELCDHLALRSFVSVGWSGGGSHALATSLDERCRGVVTLAGIAAFGQSDLDFYDGLKEADVAEYHAALRDINELISMLSDPTHGNEWCESDVRAMSSPAMQEVTVSMQRTASFGWRCLVDDYSAYLSTWGFDLDAIDVPVVIFQGDLDENVPLGHAQWLARHIPGSKLRIYQGEGHLSLVFSHREDIVASVRELLFESSELSQ
jgi:pimeloyl-ACP methyl ester carboxylesterase